MRQRFLVELDINVGDEKLDPTDVAFVVDGAGPSGPDWDIHDFNGDPGVLVHEVVRPADRLQFQVFEKRLDGTMEPCLERECQTAAECFAWLEPIERIGANYSGVLPRPALGVYRRIEDGWEEIYS